MSAEISHGVTESPEITLEPFRGTDWKIGCSSEEAVIMNRIVALSPVRSCWRKYLDIMAPVQQSGDLVQDKCLRYRWKFKNYECDLHFKFNSRRSIDQENPPSLCLNFSK